MIATILLIAAALFAAVSVVVYARPDKDRRHPTPADVWRQHSPVRAELARRLLALYGLLITGHAAMGAALIAWPLLVGLARATWWTLRLTLHVTVGLAHAVLKLTPRLFKGLTYVCAGLWCAAGWLVWHIDQLTADPTPSNAPQLAV
ncbi:hypothetical protein [Nonomuraea sp. NPDC003214]